MKTGRPVSAAMLSSRSTVMLGPTVSWKMPRPSSPSTPTRARISSSSASREGIGTPPSPLWLIEVEVAKPMAPASIASFTIPRMVAISSSVAARSEASAPSTVVRTAEWPTKTPALG